jgi:hypothetical protein
VIVGHVLDADHRIARRWIDAEAPDGFRDLPTYVDDDPWLCACGCGEPTKAGRAFVPAATSVRSTAGSHAGGAARWFDTTYGDGHAAAAGG